MCMLVEPVHACTNVDDVWHSWWTYADTCGFFCGVLLVHVLIVTTVQTDAVSTPSPLWCLQQMQTASESDEADLYKATFYLPNVNSRVQR